MTDKLHCIAEIRYPECHLTALERLQGNLTEAIERDGAPAFIDAGEVRLGSIPLDSELALFFLGWVNDFNEVIQSLNFVLIDLHNLGRCRLMFKGEPRKRYYLLVRLYFYEFYRSREIFNRAMASLKKAGFMSSKFKGEIQEAFQEAFEHTIQLRNQFVHSSVNWVGKDHFELMLLEVCRMSRHALLDQETGNFVSEQEVLGRVCEKACNILSDEGQRLSETAQRVVDFWADWTLKHGAVSRRASLKWF